MKQISFSLPALLFMFNTSFGQTPTITLIDSGRNTSVRGLSVVSDKIVWCSGSNGFVGKSTDGGKSFTWITVAGYEKRDFRDIEAFDDNTAIIMAIAEPAILLKTINGGLTWKKIFEDTTKGMFLDAMAFDRKGKGVVIGDPIDEKVYLAYTNDFGSNWHKDNLIFETKKGESFFASSGTNIQYTTTKKHPYLFVSGAIMSRMYYRDKVYPLNLQKGEESTGSNSVAVYKNKAVIVGGDFKNDKSKDSNCILINLKAKPGFSKPIMGPHGYRSCVIYYSKNTLINCGTSGVDVSYNGGKSWENISTQSFHVVQKAKKGNAIFLAGSKGKIARLILH